MQYIVAAFYHFFDFPHYVEARAPLLALLKDHQIKGSILIAAEGINGTISGTREHIDAVLGYLKKEIVRGEFEHKESVNDAPPFKRAKVRLKKETISLGEPVDNKRQGTFLSPQEWNRIIADPEVTLIDARNDYEIHLGSFEGAINPHTRNFKQLPAFVKKHFDPKEHKKIATFCTGGIRCEKFTPWLIAQGFSEVYQLKGGILKYLEEVPAAASRWRGECFVFDERVAVGHGLKPSQSAGMCKACGHALTAEDRQLPACPFCTEKY